MARTPTITQKQGATLNLAMQVKDANGTPTDLSGILVESEVRDEYWHLVDTLNIVNTGTVGVLTVSQTTTAWPQGTLVCDIKMTDTISGEVIISDTFIIDVAQLVTE